MDADAPIPVPIREQEGSGDKGRATLDCGEAETPYLGWGALKGSRDAEIFAPGPLVRLEGCLGGQGHVTDKSEGVVKGRFCPRRNLCIY